MPLSWIKRPKPPPSVDELIADGKYEKAVVLLREQFSERYPSTEERQRYAEVLVLAGRGVEAVPVLLGIADEQERYGFPEKAREALQRAAEIDPEQAEVKERLRSIRDAPRRESMEEQSAPEDPPGAADSWGAALDGVFTPDATSEGRPEFEALDAGEAEPPSLGGSPSPRSEPRTDTPEQAVDQAEPQPHGEELVAVGGEIGAGAATSLTTASEPTRAEGAGPVTANEGEITAQSLAVDPELPGGPAPETADEGEITAQSLQVDPGILGAPETQTADEGETTARSLHVDPAVLGEPEPEAAVDDGEITARSILVDPSVLGPTPTEARKEDEGEITARSLLVDPSVFGATGDGTADQDPGETTATSLPADPSIGRGEMSEPAAPVLLLPEDELEPEEDLKAEEVEELTAEDPPGVEAAEPAVRTDAPVVSSGGEAPQESLSFDVVDASETNGEAEADAPLEELPPSTELPPLLTEEDLQVALTADAQALLSGPPTRDEPGSAGDDDHLQELLTIDARALLSQSPTSDGPGALAGGKLDELLTTDARALLSDAPRPDQRSAVAASGDTRGEPLPADHSHDTGGGAASAADATPPRLDEALAADARAVTTESPAAPTPPAPLDHGSAEGEAHEGEATGVEEPPPAVHPDETHLFLSEEDLFGALTEGATPPSNGNGNGSAARGEGMARPPGEAAALAARPASPVEEEAEGAGEEQGHQLAS